MERLKIKKVKAKTTTKVMFVERLSERLGLEPKLVEKVFLGTLDLMIETIEDGNKIEFRNFLILDSKVQASRYAMNPKTLEKVLIPERRVVQFRKGQGLRDLCVEGKGDSQTSLKPSDFAPEPC